MVYLVTTTQKIDYPVPKHCESLLLLPSFITADDCSGSGLLVIVGVVKVNGTPPLQPSGGVKID